MSTIATTEKKKMGRPRQFKEKGICMGVHLHRPVTDMIEKCHRDTGISRSQIINRLLEMLVVLDPSPIVLDYVSNISEILKFSPPETVAAIITHHLATAAAEIEVYGDSKTQINPFIRKPDGTPMLGDELYKFIKDERIKELLKEKEQLVQAQEKALLLVGN